MLKISFIAWNARKNPFEHFARHNCVFIMMRPSSFSLVSKDETN